MWIQRTYGSQLLHQHQTYHSGLLHGQLRFTPRQDPPLWRVTSVSRGTTILPATRRILKRVSVWGVNPDITRYKLFSIRIPTNSPTSTGLSSIFLSIFQFIILMIRKSLREVWEAWKNIIIDKWLENVGFHHYLYYLISIYVGGPFPLCCLN